MITLSLKLPILFHAIENSGQQVHERHGAYLCPGGYKYFPYRQTHDLHVLTTIR